MADGARPAMRLSALFDPEPQTWGLRGDPFLGRYPPRQLTWLTRAQKIGVAETIEDGRDNRAGRAQAPAAGVTLLP